MLTQEFVADTFHLNCERLYLFVVIAPRDEGGNGNEQSEQGCVQGEADALGEGGVVGVLAHVPEEGDQPVNGSNEAKERRNSDDDFEDDEAALEPGDFMT